jgi:hypothetical protein
LKLFLNIWLALKRAVKKHDERYHEEIHPSSSSGCFLIVYDYWKQLVITAYPCVVALRFLQPEEDDGWISSWYRSSCFLTALLRANQIFKKSFNCYTEYYSLFHIFFMVTITFISRDIVLYYWFNAMISWASQSNFLYVIFFCFFLKYGKMKCVITSHN